MQINQSNQTTAKEIKMKKLLICSAIVFLMIFTAGLATAKTITNPVFTGYGGLIFGTPNSDIVTKTATGAEMAKLTLNEIVGSSVVANGILYYGQITYT